jgi:cobyrinic acid a,c-diamide synthase
MGSFKGIVIAGTHSGVGKTTVSLGLMAALRRRGLRVAPFKVGPDFIDPGHHALAAGCASRNLDGWMLSREYNLAAFRGAAAGADVAVVEGVMGLFDGASGDSETGSTAEMAKWLDLPVLLVVDASGMGRSAAALVQGFARFDPAVRWAGVLFNNLGSPGHLAYLKDALGSNKEIPMLGGLVRDEAVALPERHLGLVTTEDHPLPADFLNRLADRLEAGVDLSRLLADLHRIEISASRQTPTLKAGAAPVRIGVAQDPAFCFYYPDNLELLAAAGAELVFFSPLSAAALPRRLDGIYFGGGYPELHAERLAANEGLRREIRARSREGMPIHAECGGFMYLCRELRLSDGRGYPMCGCFPFGTAMHPRLRRLGYRKARLTADTLLGPAGAVLRGHEFHYSDLQAGGAGEAQTVYAVSDRAGKEGPGEGYRVHNTLGSYLHLHWGSRPESAGAFVAACRAYREAVKD